MGARLYTINNKVAGIYIRTGEVKKTIDPSCVQSAGHHGRCYKAKAGERYIVTQYRGAEFISLEDAQHANNDWLRGPCHFGVMPANGLLYVPQDPCLCFSGAKLTGFNALNAERSEAHWTIERRARVEKGPAFGKVKPVTPSSSDDWPVYRRDSSRHGASSSVVPAELKTL